MTDFRVTRVEQGQTKIRSVPIAVTPEGFWCCPSPVVFQKNLKAQNPRTKPKPKSTPPPRIDPVQKKQASLTERNLASNSSRMKFVSDDLGSLVPDNSGLNPSVVTEKPSKPKVENLQRKLAIEFGEPGTSDLKVVLFGKPAFSVKMSVHKYVLVENSSFFAEKLSEKQSPLCRLEIDDCEDVESYVEVVGLMYCKEMKERLIKQSVSRVLRILKVAELLGFISCMQSCLEHLEAVPWVGEEEEKVVSSVLRLQGESIGVTPVLKRVTSDVSNSPTGTLLLIMELVIKSNEERGRREMKSLVLGLLRENNKLSANGSSHDICNENAYNLCRSCLDALLLLFRQAAEPGFSDKSMDSKGPVAKHIALEADNILWLLEILSERRAADEFVLMWANQQELATLHSRLPTVSRHLVSCTTARLFIGIGRGEILPSKDTRLLLLQTWLQPLIDDYSWLQHGCRSFDRKVVEEGIGRTILTLPLEDQQSILLAWLGNFLKVGDNCPSLHRAFEIWWRRTFIRPYVELQGN
ncbi:BTB/POZ domain-containing protein At3g50780-like [Macadamia integrifolia]|uniref:BTB/POZ domain-containing protein At3g50780-like n=1 Tax=Macadamia integrifolia TaxID=60698 RepID=UPI001C501757|nr:BTB/POZ domain-containing protein At3g50780-like [Macadamia integrifolia]XP_042508468.1 BTB/POZ domain-containing protein At3g50780-like [Macadamia integrifolia]XP_042508469.1 BTB/POZ domain-containing protein At3g50780-like [Macadamia integrifolia]